MGTCCSKAPQAVEPGERATDALAAVGPPSDDSGRAAEACTLVVHEQPTGEESQRSASALDESAVSVVVAEEDVLEPAAAKIAVEEPAAAEKQPSHEADEVAPLAAGWRQSWHQRLLGTREGLQMLEMGAESSLAWTLPFDSISGV